MTIALKVNPVFKDLLDPLADNERKELERQLIRDGGPRDPIIVWKDHGDIVDGHNRYELCMAHNLKFETKEIEFADTKAVENWMMENQLARRNLTPMRAMYFMGLLYNNMKAPVGAGNLTSGAGKTDAKIAEQFGVSEKTVRRAGDQAKGIETIAKVHNLSSVREKLAAITEKNVSKAEMETIGKVADPVIAQAAVKHMEVAKAAGFTGPNVVKAAVKVATDEKQGVITPKVVTPAPKKEAFAVAFAAPEFDMSYNISTEPKPALAENSTVYMAVSDEELPKGIDLLKKWGMTYEGSFIFPIDGYEGTCADVKHMFLICGTKGNVIGPKKPRGSIIHTKGEPQSQMIKMIEEYHPQAKRVDMRKKRTADGWSKPN